MTQASGLSQVSPEQFPETDLTKSVLRLTGNQRFAYRFSSGDFALRIQADQVLPELNVSEILAYRLGENEQTIEADIELEIREAPLRELLLHIPKGYAIAKLNASGLSDYFQHDLEDGGQVEVRLVYGQPISGRQLVQLRLERKRPPRAPRPGGRGGQRPRHRQAHATRDATAVDLDDVQRQRHRRRRPRRVVAGDADDMCGPIVR